MSWGLVVMGGSALLGAGASVYGSNKQSQAAKAAANLSKDQYAITRGDQMPFMQSGYGAMSKLNTLLGLSPNPNQRSQMSQPLQGYQPPQQAYAPTPGGGVDPRMQLGPAQGQTHQWNVPEAGMGNLPLNRILTLRAQNGDRQAQQMLQRMGA